MISGKKVLMVSTHGNMLIRMLMHIDHLIKNGNTVECACSNTGDWLDDLKKIVPVKAISFKGVPSPLSIRRILSNVKAGKEFFQFVKNNDFDFIICNQPVDAIFCRKTGAKLGIPVLYIVHGYNFYHGAPKLKSLIYKTLEKHYTKKTAALIVMNKEDFNFAQKTKAKNAFLINGIGYTSVKHTDCKIMSTDEIRKNLDLKDDEIMLLSLGTMDKNKNHIKIVDALHYLKNPKIKYFVCGDKNYPPLEKRIKKYNLENNVKLLGFRRDAQQLLEICDIFVFPSMHEGLPVSVIEAMALGKPLIVSNARGCVDLVEDNENGLVVNLKQRNGFAKAIYKLLNDKDLCNKMRDENLKRVKKYSISEVLSQMEQIYDEMFTN